MGVPARIDREAVLATLATLADAVEKAHTFDTIKSEVEKNIGLLELDTARKRKSRAASAKIDLAVLTGMLQAYREMAALLAGKRPGRS